MTRLLSILGLFTLVLPVAVPASCEGWNTTDTARTRNTGWVQQCLARGADPNSRGSAAASCGAAFERRGGPVAARGGSKREHLDRVRRHPLALRQ